MSISKRKKRYSIYFIGIIIVIIFGIYMNNMQQSFFNESNFAKSGSDSDIKQLKNVFSEDLEGNEQLDLQVGNIYKNINQDKSARAKRVIGTIQNKKVTAKEMELRALRFQLKGSDNPYLDAWNDLKLELESNRLAKKYKIDVKSDVEENMANVKEGIEQEETLKEAFERRIKRYGMTEEDYWNLWYFLNEKTLIQYRLEEYLEENKLGAIDINNIPNKITDKEYEDKINGIEMSKKGEAQ
ncbi:hypothetical protein [Sinanaerobacter sp. ZZT-01]|uniref:hypothetical protein n=1 Tax=Sinanaerobacter sp. ZZT-01 TaxID=3111540 RepID=UPI002D78B782|nr:hypothetical protein [Sinanaerobacter sp. ZZT-01]WRR94385.1 hypothetical protein U5921_04515 [Sinanaerobacter sp. ZZT-01]